MTKMRILFVDDQQEVLRGLERMLHSMRNEWEMGFAGSAREALGILEETGADVVVSDMKMPGMDGAELLSEVMERYPQVIRIILSGHSDEQATMRSIGPTHQYLVKPCNADTLKATIGRALGLRRLLADDSLKQVISQIRSLPSIPALYMEIVKELRLQDSSLKKVGEIISKDVGMTAKVLQLVNSAFFGVPRHISTPAQAVGLLGLETVRALVLSVQVFSEFRNAVLPGLNMDALWAHSMAVGGGAKAICRSEKLDDKVVDDAFIAGLVHDVGKLVLAAGIPRKYKEILSAAQREGATSENAEGRALGTTHAEVGGYLLGLWGLPDPIVEAVAFHHQPSRCVSRVFSPLTAVHAADILVCSLSDSGTVGAAPQIDSTYLAELKLEGRLEPWTDICRKIGESGGAHAG